MRESAYYYPASFWRATEGDWIKSLLLFYDEVAILLPDHVKGRHLDADPSVAGPMKEQGLPNPLTSVCQGMYNLLIFRE